MPDRGSPASEIGRYFAADPCRCSAARRSRSGSAGSSLVRHSMPFVGETKMNGRGRPVCLPDRWRPPTVIGVGDRASHERAAGPSRTKIAGLRFLGVLPRPFDSAEAVHGVRRDQAPMMAQCTETEKLHASDALAEQHMPGCVCSMHLEYVLRDVQTDRDSLLHGRLLRWQFDTVTLAHRSAGWHTSSAGSTHEGRGCCSCGEATVSARGCAIFGGKAAPSFSQLTHN